MTLGKLYIISAPSGAGKSSLLKALLEKDSKVQISISHTTRHPRPGEQDGLAYHFTKIEEFQKKVASGDFLEHAQVFDNFYGTSEQGVKDQINKGLDVILEIDWQGARQIRTRFSDCITIYIIPPSIQALVDRLKSRGHDSDEVIQRRMADAQNEISHIHEFDYLIINDDFEQALKDIGAIFNANRLNLASQLDSNSALIEELLASAID